MHKIGFLIVSFALLVACNLYKEVEITEIGDYHFEHAGGDEVNFKINIKVANPNGYNIKLKKNTFSLLANGSEIGTTTLTEDLKIYKKSEQIYQPVFRSSLKELTNGVLQSGAIGSFFGGKKITLAIKGKIKAKALDVGKKIDLDVAKKVELKDLQF